MNALIESLNRWGEIAIPLAGQALWQSSLLIVVLLALDLLLRHRVRAGFRYALWMLLLVKLVLPPSLALPTGAGYWIDRSAKPEVTLKPADPVLISRPSEVSYVQVDDGAFDLPMFPATVESTPVEAMAPPAPRLTRAGWLLATWLAGIIGLLAWMLGRWRWVNRLVRASEPAPAALQTLLASVNVCRAACRQSGRDRHSVRSGMAGERTSAFENAGVSINAAVPSGALGETRPTIAVRLTDTAMSPAVCGLFRPVILLPRKLVAKLTTEQLGTVLLHELIHLRRRDLWVNCAQTLLQIAAWWHPLLWLANARIRRVREEAVDEAVACALRDDADAYPATLLEVAKLTFTRPLMTLGLVGILESKNALKQRIRRLLELPPLESTRLKWWQWVAVAALALTALPMAQGQRQPSVRQLIEAPTAPTLASRSGISYDQKTDLAQWENPKPRDTVIGYEFPPPTNRSRSFEAAESSQARLYAQAERGKPQTIALAVWAVKLDRKAWAWLTRHPGTRRVDGRTNTYVLAGESLGEWLNTQAGVEKLKGGQFSGLEHRSLVVGDYSPDRRTIDPYSQARIELTPWFDQADPRQVWLKLDSIIDWHGEMWKSRNVFVPSPSGDLLGAGGWIEAIERATGYVNQQLKTEATLVGLGDWLFVGERYDRNTIEPVFAVVVQPLLAQNASNENQLNERRALTQSVAQVQRSHTQVQPELEPAQNAVEAINQPLPNIAIEVRAVEVSVEDSWALGFDWFRGTQLEKQMPLVPGNSTNGVAILTDPQFRVVIKALEQRGGVDLLFAPRATVVSGQQKQFQMGELPDPKQEPNSLRPPGQVPLLDVIPYLAADSLTIHMTLIPTIVQFLDLTEPAGQVDPPARKPDDPAAAGQRSASKPLPQFRIRQVAQSVFLNNGHTAVMRVPSTNSPVAPGTNATQLLLFITPTIVEPQSPSPDPTQNGSQTPSRRITPEDLAALYSPWMSKTTQGQPLPSGLAVSSNTAEAKTDVVREERWVELRRKLADARQREADGNLIQAAQLLDEAYRSAKELAPGTEVELSESVDAIIALRSKLAEAYRKLGDFSGANEHLVAGLNVAPTNPRLLELKRTNDADLVREGGSESAVKVQNAKLLIEKGRLDEAEALLREAARIEPGRPETAFLLDRIQQLRSERSQSAPGSNSTSPGRHTMMEKLNSITLDQLNFERLPLSEVIKELSDEARRSDPDKTGVSFILVSRLESPDGAEGGAVTNDIANAVIHITPPLKHLRLIDALNAIVMVSDQRIKFTVEEFAVVFTPATSEPVKLETRQFQVNTNTFYEGLRRFDPSLAVQTSIPAANGGRFLTTPNDAKAVIPTLRKYFQSVGVELAPPKTFFFNDRKGLLLVRATAEDFQFIERAIEALVPEPAQIQLEARAVELSPDEVKSVASSLPPYLFPPDASTDPNAGPASLSVSAILTGQQFSNVLSGLRLGMMGTPEATGPMRLTTLSGRQTRFKTAQTFTVVTNVANTPTGPQYETSDIELGKFWDITPEVSADGYTIHLGAKFDRVEFLGYNDPATAGKPPGTPLPHFSVRSVNTKVSLWDGQTLVMGGITIDTPKLAKDKVPVLGDIPLVGKMFRYEKRFVETKHVVVFITPTIIDAAGNPVHKPGELPLANELVPPQRPTEP